MDSNDVEDVLGVLLEMESVEHENYMVSRRGVFEVRIFELKPCNE